MKFKKFIVKFFGIKGDHLSLREQMKFTKTEVKTHYIHSQHMVVHAEGQLNSDIWGEYKEDFNPRTMFDFTNNLTHNLMRELVDKKLIEIEEENFRDSETLSPMKKVRIKILVLPPSIKS